MPLDKGCIPPKRAPANEPRRMLASTLRLPAHATGSKNERLSGPEAVSESRGFVPGAARILLGGSGSQARRLVGEPRR
jgi:hypothetical protein